MTIYPPVAKKKPYKLEKFDQVRIDNYYWLNERDNPEVLDYLNQENEYYQKSTEHTKVFQEKLFEEMKGRIKEDDSSVPYFYNGYWYITRYETGKDYPIYTRKKGTMDSEEEILFDCNQMAKGYQYFSLGSFSVSDDNKWAVFGVDTISRRQYVLQIKNLETGDNNIMKTALVVDDTSYIREDIKEILTDQGYEVYEATDGLEAFEMYKKVKPTIVTMDINMPRVHGLKATQLITDYDPEAKIMLCSTMITFQNYIRMGKEAGVKGFLSKPFTEEEFMEELAKLFV